MTHLPIIERRFTSFFFLLLLSSTLAFSALTPTSLEQFFFPPDIETVLAWTLQPAEQPQLSYTISNYWGGTVANGQATVAEGKVTLPVRVPAGYYEIVFHETAQQFGLCALPAYTGEYDLFFGIDAALSWLAPKEGRDALLKILARSGIGIARERMYWGEVSTSATTWNWENRYAPLREMYQQQGIKVLEVFHDAPQWSGSNDFNRYPQILNPVAGAWAGIGKQYAGCWGALEIWNEPDLASFSGGASIEQYPPMVKAIAYAYARDGLTTPLGGGVFSNPSEQLLQLSALNGLLDHLDFLSFHSYYGAMEIEQRVKQYREYVTAAGRPALPLWITECGKPWTRGPQRPPMMEDAVSALDITMAAIEARACGVAGHYPFVYPFYEESDKAFGMMGKEQSPQRSMAAYAQAVRVLSHRRYAGDLILEDAAALRARVFTNNDDALIVLYTGAVKVDALLSLPVKPDALAGIDGRPLSLTAAGAVPIPDGLTYAWVKEPALQRKMNTRTLAATLTAAAHKPQPPRAQPSPLILSFPAAAKVMPGIGRSAQGYVISPEAALKLPLTIRVTNLSEEARQLTLAWQVLVNDKRSTPQPGAVLDVAPRGFSDATVTVNLGAPFQEASRGILIITATCEGISVSPLALPFTMPPSLEAVLQQYPRKEAVTLNNPALWAKNITGAGQMDISATAEGYWLLKVTFGAGDRWVYPQQKMAPGLFTGKKGIVLRARCSNPASPKVLIWEADGTGYFTNFSIIPADGQWHTALLDFTDFTLLYGNTDENGRFDLDQVEKISIGMNSLANENSLEVSDCYIIGE